MATASAFEQAQTVYNEANAARRARQQRLTAAQAALSLAENPPGKGDTRSPKLEALAAEYLAGRPASPDRLRREVAVLEDEIELAAPAFRAAADAWRRAQEIEGERLLAVLRPRHQGAVRRLADLVEQLSKAVRAERAIRAEAALPMGATLPDASLEFGELGETNSPLGRWAARMHATGALS